MSDRPESLPDEARPGLGTASSIHPPGGPGPVEPPPTVAAPVTFDFSVPLITVNNPRSLLKDTDFATMAATALAPDGTAITKYGPISKSLGDLGEGARTDPAMSLTGIEVPEGGSLACTFVVVNRGAWIGDNQALNDMDSVAEAVLGALIQGQIVFSATQGALDVLSIAESLSVAAIVIGALEALTVILADCDGIVVGGAMTVGQTELLSGAATQALETPIDYPGTDSPVGCGANSDYTVTYTVGQPPTIVVPDLLRLPLAEVSKLLSEAGLRGVELTVNRDNEDPGVIAQDPPPGTLVSPGSVVQITVNELFGGPPGHPPGRQPD
jgi:hypothetical protein